MKMAIAAVPIVWILSVAFVLSLAGTRQNYTELRAQHYEAQLGRNESGENLSDLFEYKSRAAFSYADNLESFVLVGLLPVVAFWTINSCWSAFRRKAAASTIANLGENQ